jgi:hemoglobin-like flavoprotein
MNAEVIERCLEAMAKRSVTVGEVYRRLFSWPRTSALFVRDTDGAVRGQMLQQVFETLLDLVGSNHYAEVLIGTEWLNHQNLGVPARQFELFFEAMISSFRDVLGPQWTPEIEAAWQSVVTRIGAIILQRSLPA